MGQSTKKPSFEKTEQPKEKKIIHYLEDSLLPIIKMCPDFPSTEDFGENVSYRALFSLNMIGDTDIALRYIEKIIDSQIQRWVYIPNKTSNVIFRWKSEAVSINHHQILVLYYAKDFSLDVGRTITMTPTSGQYYQQYGFGCQPYQNNNMMDQFQRQMQATADMMKNSPMYTASK